MRGSDTDTTSLDLLLDAICNTFGGIVFLAILLSLMLMGKTAKQKSAQQDSPTSTASAAEARDLLAELDSVMAEHATLSIIAAQLPAGSGFDDGGQLQTLLDSVTELQHTHTGWVSDNAELAKQLAEKLAENAELQQENETLADELASEAVATQQMQQQFAAEVARVTKNVALPRVRQSVQAKLIVLFKGGRLYAAHRHTVPVDDGFFRNQVTATKVSPNDYEVLPIEGTGVGVASPEDAAAAAAFVAKYARPKETFTFAVWPDSFAQFAVLQEVLIDRGILYETWPQKSGKPLELALGTTVPAFVQ